MDDIKMLRQWALFSACGAFLGLLIAYLLEVLWFILRWLLLGYGDSGPEWIATVNVIIFWLSLLMCIFVAQVYFYKSIKKQ